MGNKIYVQGSYIDVHDNEVVNLSVDKSGAVSVNGNELAGTTQTGGQTLPAELDTPEAWVLWRALQETGLVDAELRLGNGVTKLQAMYMALLMSDRLWQAVRWKPFEDWWGVKRLAQEQQRMKDTGRLPKRAKDIEHAMEEKTE